MKHACKSLTVEELISYFKEIFQVEDDDFFEINYKYQNLLLYEDKTISEVLDDSYSYIRITHRKCNTLKKCFEKYLRQWNSAVAKAKQTDAYKMFSQTLSKESCFHLMFSSPCALIAGSENSGFGALFPGVFFIIGFEVEKRETYGFKANFLHPSELKELREMFDVAYIEFPGVPEFFHLALWESVAMLVRPEGSVITTVYPLFYFRGGMKNPLYNNERPEEHYLPKIPELRERVVNLLSTVDPGPYNPSTSPFEGDIDDDELNLMEIMTDFISTYFHDPRPCETLIGGKVVNWLGGKHIAHLYHLTRNKVTNFYESDL